jgi:spore coat protein A
MLARPLWLFGVPQVVAGVCVLAAATPPGGDGAEGCRNYLRTAELAPQFNTPLPIPADRKPYYTRSDGTPVWVLHAREYTWRPTAGVCIPKWGFEGTTPGPTIRVKPHRPVELDVFNQLPERLYNPYVDPTNPKARVKPPSPILAKYSPFGPHPTLPPAPFDGEPYSRSQYELNPQLTIHLHGGHQTPPYDGYPATMFGPGHSFVYDYPNRQRPTTLWYHDHAMDHTRGHVLMGLAGFYLIDDDARDKKLGLPTGKFDLPIMFQRVPAEMLEPVPDPTKPGGTMLSTNPVWTVNNTLAPYLDVTNRPYRFRFLNGNDESPLQIWTTTGKDDPRSFASQAYLQQVGTDGGLMNHVAVNESAPAKTKIRLFPAERADVVIDFSRVRTPTTFYLQARTPHAFIGDGHKFGPDPTVEKPQPLLAFRVNPTQSNPPRFGPPGGRLLPTDPIAKLSRRGAHHRTFVFEFKHLGTPPFATVNGRFFDEQHTYARPKLGATEVWRLVNRTDGYHPIHIHDIFFQVISRKDKNGNPVERQRGDWGSGNLAWKDVFVIPPHGSVTIVGKFTDNKGRYVFHCHNLIHEDGGMMAQFDVGESGADASPTPAQMHLTG